MKINYTQILTKYNGITPHLDEHDMPLTLGAAMIKATDCPSEKDAALGPLGKYRVGEMGMTIEKGLELTSAQVKQLRDRCEDVFIVPSLVFAILTLIDAELAKSEDKVAEKAVEKKVK